MAWTDRALASFRRAGVPVPRPLADVWLEQSLHAAATASERERRRVWEAWAAAVRDGERRCERARRNVRRWPAVAAGAGLLAVPLDGEVALGAYALSAVGIVQTVRAVRTLFRPPASPPQPVLPAALPPPPPRSSAAFAAVRRLEEIRHELHRVLAPAWSGGSLLHEAAGSALHAAGSADLALRELAARAGWLESLPAATAATERTRLMGELQAGLTAQERLLEAAVELSVAAVSGGTSGALPLIRLREAADSLTALAAGVRTVRDLGQAAPAPFATA